MPVFLYLHPNPNSGGNTSATIAAQAPYTGRIRFTGTQFTIQNNDSYAWTDCTLDVNGGAFRSGYELDAQRIEPGQTYAVGAMQFAKPGGERFNPGTMRPNTFGAECQTPDGVGFLSAEW